ncbi:TetR family transcriptional regulator [Advenella sp. WQ 585]|uniref:TetR family transcriptional regulator n=1 Tax=Advenella mandrilli TaxID=2800330 RepID=A0ABS1EDT9_9BURK|nr:TetR family transcriptional regulator [Advenella mandrilli]MBK1781836.1 TetR family transcriptional regulator [Advenella mandrilli]MDY0273544.1 TetR family transcriptional regulator [Advenella sp.]
METTGKKLTAAERKSMTVTSVVELAGVLNPANITTAAIAKEMNLTQGALFRHFSNKEAIWEEVMTWVEQTLFGRVMKAIESNPHSAVAALESVFMQHVDFVLTYPGVPRILFGELQHVEATPAKRIVQDLIQRYGERIKQLLEQGKAQKEIVFDLDSGAAATLFVGTLQGLVMQSLLAGEIQLINKNAQSVFALYLRSIRS